MFVVQLRASSLLRWPTASWTPWILLQARRQPNRFRAGPRPKYSRTRLVLGGGSVVSGVQNRYRCPCPMLKEPTAGLRVGVESERNRRAVFFEEAAPSHNARRSTRPRPREVQTHVRSMFGQTLSTKPSTSSRWVGVKRGERSKSSPGPRG